MANGKSGRNNRVSPIATIIGLLVLVVASFFGIDITDMIPKETVVTVEQEETNVGKDV